MKIVVNKCYGGFVLSDEALNDLGWEAEDFRFIDVEDTEIHTSTALIALIEEKGSEYVSGSCSTLKIEEIPDGVTDWEIKEYDGFEVVTYVLNGKLFHG